MPTENDLPADARAALNAGKKIEAIKIVREATGLGLKEAKDLVEAYERGESPGLPARPASAELPPAAVAALKAGNKIEAIKLIREHTGLDLKEAKDLADSYQPTRTDSGGGSASGDRSPRPAKSGCLVLLAATIGAVGAIAGYVVYLA